MLEKQLAAQVVAEVKKAVVGKDDIVVKALLAILARGHLLLEDIPGVGKTTLAIAFSKALGLKYNRVQFTPDVMPSDLTRIPCSPWPARLPASPCPRYSTPWWKKPTPAAPSSRTLHPESAFQRRAVCQEESLRHTALLFSQSKL